MEREMDSNSTALSNGILNLSAPPISNQNILEESNHRTWELPRNVTVILGAQWGDEGKGKILDFLIGHRKIDIIARAQGGNNAGHTVIANGRQYAFHLLPSGMLNYHCLNVIGNGVVVNLASLFQELDENDITKPVATEQNGAVAIESEPWSNRLVISDRCHLVFDVHLQADAHQEGMLKDTAKIGTTKKGIGPTYASKCFRTGIRISELLYDFDAFSVRYRNLVAHYKRQFPGIQVDEEMELVSLKGYAQRLKQLGIVKDTVKLLYELRLSGKSLMVEGANGALLDLDFGTYPYVTSSNSTVGGACTGLGIPPTAICSVIGVMKAYTTRVGTGPFPTELFDGDGERLQQIGSEFGVTTGRKRRCGWLDLVLLRTTAIVNGFTALAMTKVDVLDGFEFIKVGVGYRLDGEEKPTDWPPACEAEWNRIVVEYKVFPGWMQSTTAVTNYNNLPENCRNYIEFVERFLRVPVAYIGVGQTREALIVRNADA